MPPRLSSPNFEDQLSLQVARFADPVRLGSIRELVPGNCGRPNRAHIQKSQHSLEMCTIAFNVGPQGLDIIPVRFKPLRRRRDPDKLSAGLQYRIAAERGHYPQRYRTPHRKSGRSR